MKSAVCSFVAVLCALAAVITIYNGEATWFFAIATIGFVMTSGLAFIRARQLRHAMFTLALLALAQPAFAGGGGGGEADLGGGLVGMLVVVVVLGLIAGIARLLRPRPPQGD